MNGIYAFVRATGKAAKSVAKSVGDAVVQSTGVVAKSVGDAVVKSTGVVARLGENTIAEYHYRILALLEGTSSDIIENKSDLAYKIIYGCVCALISIGICIGYTLVGLCANIYNNPIPTTLFLMAVVSFWRLIYVERLGKVQMINFANSEKEKWIRKIDEKLSELSCDLIPKTYVGKKESDEWVITN